MKFPGDWFLPVFTAVIVALGVALGLCGANDTQAGRESSQPISVSRHQLISGLAVIEFLRTPAGAFVVGSTVTAAIFGVAAFICGNPGTPKRSNQNERANDPKKPSPGD